MKMAASSVWRGLCRQIAMHKLPASENTASMAPLVIAVRYKQKNQQRYKSPHESSKGSGQKWVSRRKEILQKPKDTRGTDSQTWQARVPIDDVWIRTYYPKQHLDLGETIKRHREYAVPAMLDSEDSFIYADMDLDMTTSKKTKFLSYLHKTVFLPHFFDDGNPRRCIVFSKSDEDRRKAEELGAIAAGGADLIQQVSNDLLTKDDFEFVLCTPEILTDLLAIRKQLRDRFPNKQNGNLSQNIEEMLSLFSKSLSYKSQKVTDAVAKLQIPFGRLDMTTEELSKNFEEIVKSVSEHRPKNMGPIIQKIFIVSPPSEERFLLRLEGNVPGYVAKSSEPIMAEEEEADESQDVDSDEEEEKAAAKR